jgi:hypothetical protein
MQKIRNFIGELTIIPMSWYRHVLEASMVDLNKVNMRAVGEALGLDLENYRVVNPDKDDGWITFENASGDVYQSTHYTGVPVMCNDYYTLNHFGELVQKQHCINKEAGIDENVTVRTIKKSQERLASELEEFDSEWYDLTRTKWPAEWEYLREIKILVKSGGREEIMKRYLLHSAAILVALGERIPLPADEQKASANYAVKFFSPLSAAPQQRRK